VDDDAFNHRDKEVAVTLFCLEDIEPCAAMGRDVDECAFLLVTPRCRATYTDVVPSERAVLAALLQFGPEDFPAGDRGKSGVPKGCVDLIGRMQKARRLSHQLSRRVTKHLRKSGIAPNDGATQDSNAADRRAVHAASLFPSEFAAILRRAD
jgi:hypothetical protein